MRLGIRGHDVGQYPFKTLCEKIHENNLKSIQLVLKKAVQDCEIEKGSLTPGLASYLKENLDENHVKTSILGCYINLAHPDEKERNELLNWFKEHIRFAGSLGCKVVGTESGAPNKEYVYTPENNSEEAFQRTVTSLKDLVAEAEKFGIIVGIEGVTKHILNTPERLKRALDEVNSNNIQVIFDPINFLDESNYERQDEIIKKSFDLFGERIVMIHAKDFIYEDGKIKPVPIGKGQFNFPLLLSLIKKNKPFIDVILEETTPDTVKESIDYLEKMYMKIDNE